MEKKKVILIGRSGAGKTSFLQAVHGEIPHYKKTQAVEFTDGFLDTPGEYMENRALYRALIVTAADADIVALVLDCTDTQSVFPPAFSSVFAKPCIGLITKTDLSGEDSIRRAEKCLRMAGCEYTIRTSSANRCGIEEFMKFCEGRSPE